MADSFGLAFFRAQDAAKSCLPLEGTVLMTIADKDKNKTVIEMAKQLARIGFKIKATEGTKVYLADHGVESELIYKMREQRPNITDVITDGGIQLVINTPRGKESKADDSYIRKAAIRFKVPYVTTIAAASAAVKGIAACINDKPRVRSLQEYHSAIK